MRRLTKFRLNKKKKKIITYIIFVMGFFLSAFFLLKTALKPLQSFINPPLKPAYLVSDAAPVQADFFFSNEDNSPAFSDLVAAEINKANKTLEIAVYVIKSDPIKKAIYAAYQRGVKVTLILDYRKKADHDIFFKDLPAGITRLDLGSYSPNTVLMHNKFALIDRGTPAQKLLFGSFNWTEMQEKYDHSFVMLSTDFNLISSFGREYDRLVSSEFGPAKLKDKKYHSWDLSLKTKLATNYEVWFGPGPDQANIKTRIIDLIRGAKKDLKIMIWTFTDKDIAKEIINQAQTGIKITIIADGFSFYEPNSVFTYLLNEKARLKLDNLEIITDPKVADSNAPKVEGVEEIISFLHYHVLIVDDEKIFFGTNNFSRSGAAYNDEASIITDEPKIIKAFQKSFDYNYKINEAPH